MLNVFSITLLPSVYLVNMQHGFSIRVENSADPDCFLSWMKMHASEVKCILNHLEIVENHMLYYKDIYFFELP